MKIITTQHLGCLLMLLIVTACSRPVAYFQPSAREHFATKPSDATPLVTPSPTVEQAPSVEATPAQQLAQANSSLNEIDALVSTNTKLATNKTVQKRLNRVRTLLASTSAKATMAPTETAAPKKMNLMERMMLKKMNKKITKQLAPNNPEKSLVSKSILALSIVLILGGILLLTLTSGGGFALGAIAFAAGLVILLIELL